MGVINETVEVARENGKECPDTFLPTFEKYMELKFGTRYTDDGVKLYPRKMLKWQDLDAYGNVTGQRFSMLEASLIMNIDATFEGRNDG